MDTLLYTPNRSVTDYFDYSFDELKNDEYIKFVYRNICYIKDSYELRVKRVPKFVIFISRSYAVYSGIVPTIVGDNIFDTVVFVESFEEASSVLASVNLVKNENPRLKLEEVRKKKILDKALMVNSDDSVLVIPILYSGNVKTEAFINGFKNAVTSVNFCNGENNHSISPDLFTVSLGNTHFGGVHQSLISLSSAIITISTSNMVSAIENTLTNLKYALSYNHQDVPRMGLGMTNAQTHVIWDTDGINDYQGYFELFLGALQRSDDGGINHRYLFNEDISEIGNIFLIRHNMPEKSGYDALRFINNKLRAAREGVDDNGIASFYENREIVEQLFNYGSVNDTIYVFSNGDIAFAGAVSSYSYISTSIGSYYDSTTSTAVTQGTYSTLFNPHEPISIELRINENGMYEVLTSMTEKSMVYDSIFLFAENLAKYIGFNMINRTSYYALFPVNVKLRTHNIFVAVFIYNLFKSVINNTSIVTYIILINFLLRYEYQLGFVETDKSVENNFTYIFSD